MKVSIIGCGLIGGKRAAAMPGGVTLRYCCDLRAESAEALAAKHPGATAATDWTAAATAADVDIVVVATTHDQLARITATAAAAGKHVLVEKPGARFAAELDPAVEAAHSTGVCVRVGFNHRYHPAMRRALALIREGSLGELMHLRARYGHGGREGYDKEWRAVKAVSGGGELVDQGMHLIDLSRMFLAEEFTRVQGAITTAYWNMPVEDNGFLILQTPTGKVAFLHASWTEWRNIFSMEIYGRKAKLEISGLGGSYGLEKLTRWENIVGKPSPAEVEEFPGPDQSWKLEFEEFLEDIRLGRPSVPGLMDAQQALRVIERVYTEGTAPDDHHP